MAKKLNEGKRLWLYAAAAGIPIALMLVSFFLMGSLPFGDKTILLIDSNIQYIDFTSYLRTIFRGENDILYTFSKNLGGEMVSLLCYYLLSPFSLLFALGTDRNLPLVFTAVAVLKISACGLSFFWASSKRFGRSWQHLIFSTAYALMGYNAMYAWNIMWLDGILILPLLGLGLERLCRGESAKLYIGALAYSLLTNFYIGYMLCIASVLFLFALMVSRKASLKEKGRIFGKFVFASCVGGFVSAFAWMPTFLALLSGRASAVSEGFNLHPTYNLLGLAGKLVAGSSGENQLLSGTPHVFCGLFVVLLAICFVFHGGISFRKRLAVLSVLGFVLVTTLFRGTDAIWHGFSPNNAFNFRYSFLISYLLVMMALYAWQERGELRILWAALAGAAVVFLCAAVTGMKFIMGLDFLSLPGIALSAVCAVTALGGLLLEKRGRPVGAALLLLVSMAEMGGNYYLSAYAVVGKVPSLEMTSYLSVTQEIRPVLDEIRQRDNGLYRLEKNFMRSKNDAMFYNYNGLSHFSSSQQKRELKFLEKMGLTKSRNIGVHFGAGSTGEADSLLGVKYLLSRDTTPETKGYTYLTTVGDVHVYENGNALPMVMLAGSGVRTVNMDEPDYFALHNDLWEAISSMEEPLLRREDPAEIRLDNLVAQPQEDGATRYQRVNGDLPASICYTITVTDDAPLYYYFTAPEAQKAGIYVNGAYAGVYFHDDRWDMSLAGTFQPGDVVEIVVETYQDAMVIGNALFYYEDQDALVTHAGAVRQRPVTVERQSSSRLTGSFTAGEDQLLLTTIPYDTGWRLYIDGEPAAYFRALDALLAATVPAGEHTYELRYIPRGLVPGCGISLAAWLTGAAWLLYKRKRQQ